MSYLEWLITILSNNLLMLKFLLVIGLILILIAAVPSLSIPILKNTQLNITKNQSIMLAAIGGILIAIGILGLYQLENDPPIINEVQIKPYPTATAFKNGTPINITVIAEPDSNIIQKIFQKPTDLEFEFNLPPHKEGPQAQNTATFLIYPTEKGLNFIKINVTDRAKNSSDVSWIHDYTIILPNQPPEFTDEISYERKGKKIEIIANATDQESDYIYYKFYRMPPYASNFSEILPQESYTENWRIFAPGQNDSGPNKLKISIQDGYENGTWGDHKPILKYLWINI